MATASFRKWITQNHYVIPLLSFILPATIRTIPELLIGPYIVGFDTMGFYVPTALLFLHGGIDLWDYLAVAPLFYTIIMTIVTTGVPIIIALKIIPPLLLGFLGFSIFLYAFKGLGWSSVKSLAPALLGTIYFVSLRISWDMLRSELGLIFLFIVLTLLAKNKNVSGKRYTLLSLAMMAVVLSHQLVSVIMFGILFFTLILELRKNITKYFKLIVAILPAILFFFIVYYTAVTPVVFQDTNNTMSLSANWLDFPSYQSMIASEVGFFLYCFLPLLPIAMLSINRFSNLQLRYWLLLSLLLLLSPFTFVSPYRWLLLLVYPFAFYVTDSLSCLKSIKWRGFKFTIHRIVILYLILSTCFLSFGFILSTPENPFIYFNSQSLNCFQYQIPTSMLQNTISIRDFEGTVNALEWFNDNENSTAILLTHTVFYSWSLLTLSNKQAMYYGFDNPEKAAELAQQDGYKDVFLVWWIKGEGWYNQSTLPTSFQEVYHSERIAIYYFNSTA